MLTLEGSIHDQTISFKEQNTMFCYSGIFPKTTPYLTTVFGTHRTSTQYVYTLYNKKGSLTDLLK